MHHAVARAEPDVIIHQMTALSGSSDLRHFDRTFEVTNRLRTEGTDYLLEAGRAAGAGRFIAQSFTGWPNIRAGSPVKTEEDPLDRNRRPAWPDRCGPSGTWRRPCPPRGHRTGSCSGTACCTGREPRMRWPRWGTGRRASTT